MKDKSQRRAIIETIGVIGSPVGMDTDGVLTVKAGRQGEILGCLRRIRAMIWRISKGKCG